MSHVASAQYAHTLPGQPPKAWEPLEKHLAEVAEMAATFAEQLQAPGWGNAAGWLHDLGKASDAFQEYLRRSNPGEAMEASEERSGGKVDHSTFGARHASTLFPDHRGSMLAFCIAGHHTGLPNAVPEDDASGRSTLQERLLKKDIPDVRRLPEFRFDAIRLPALRCAARSEQGFTLAFFTRMVFSCLIDADRTCTEAFCDRTSAAERAVERPRLEDLRKALTKHLEYKQRHATSTPVNVVRRNVLEECIRAADGEPGFYSLQVPTGGGKTLSSLAFALHHARTTMRRVIVAIPFTSIIEQTADVYREALGVLAQTGLIEHHTNIRPERDTRANRMATENWDAPLIVTTNVQLLESLFSAATTPCRKLHQIANSVIVLDEAQTLPTELLAPTLRVLRELVTNYGCTIVLCTATQPALEEREDFAIGLENVRPIIAEPLPLFNALRRVQVKHEGPLTDAEVVLRLADTPRVLCIVNTRAHARVLYLGLIEPAALSGEAERTGCFHLSTLMCGAHRRKVLRAIRARLQNTEDLPCRVVSTQLVEAGVDLDFPVVYRAAAGIDSIAQAAGRCNREGRLPWATTHVFDTPERGLKGFLEDARQAGSEVLALPQFEDDPLSPQAVQAYFHHLYWKHRAAWDAKNVLECFQISRQQLLFQFRNAQERYRIIEDTQLPILVPFDAKAEKLRDALLNQQIEFEPQRNLQPYLVSVPRTTHDRLIKDHAVQPHASGVSLLLRKELYREDTGLMLEGYGLETLIG